jgi:phosphoribosylformylglycinamidine synthase I
MLEKAFRGNDMSLVKALVVTGYGLNCDYETDFALKLAGAESHRVHMNQLVASERQGFPQTLERYHILVIGGGFSWADDHGAGVLMASKLKHHLGSQLQRFIDEGKLCLGICNGFQALVNLGLLPAFDRRNWERRIALIHNDSGNFVDTWVNLRVDPQTPCVFTKGLSHLELPVRHGEGKFYASEEDIDRLFADKQIVLQYADETGEQAKGAWQFNPNGSLRDIAGICDPTGRIFGLMPHPEAYNHFTNHPDWPRRKQELLRRDEDVEDTTGDGIYIFRNAVAYIKETFQL